MDNNKPLPEPPLETLTSEDKFHNVTLKQFNEECNRFRRIYTDKRYSLNFMRKAFGCLFVVSARMSPLLTDEEKRLAQSWWEMLATDWMMRQGMMAAAGHPEYNNEAERKRAEAWENR